MKKRYTEEQIIGVIRGHEAGTRVDEIYPKMNIFSGTFSNWRSKCAGVEVNGDKRLKHLECGEQ